MGLIRIPDKVWEAARSHLSGAPGEHFAFFLARWTYSRGEPVFLVRDVICVPDTEIAVAHDGMELSLASILGAVNKAVRESSCLIEIHNHCGSVPRFSMTDRNNLPGFVEYVLSSLPGRPYAATVFGETTLYGENYVPDGRNGILDSITVVGSQLRQIVSRDDDDIRIAIDGQFARQLPWFTEIGQRQLGRLRIGIVGCGGTGSLVIQNLAYLGCRDFILVDHDRAEATNANRLVTADPADIETAKVILGRRLIKRVAPESHVLVLNADLRNSESLDALKGVDVLFGCVDNDGARLIMNELSLAYSIPYIDSAVGIEGENGYVHAAGGRVAIVLPGGPCLLCMGQIDINEAAYFLSPAKERERNLAMGYVSGIEIPAPAIVSLNAQLAASAVNEFAVLVSGLRPVNTFTDFDLLGTGRKIKGQWLSPVVYEKDPGCIQCAIGGLGDEASIEARYTQRNELPLVSLSLRPHLDE
jgi:molybdopterin/thiamine biosynthesis adenylyltransferase